MTIIKVDLVFIREDGSKNFVTISDNPKLVDTAGPMTFNETMVVARAADMVNDYVEFEKKRRASTVMRTDGITEDDSDEVKH